jgi:hypothetical protein
MICFSGKTIISFGGLYDRYFFTLSGNYSTYTYGLTAVALEYFISIGINIFDSFVDGIF